MRSSPLLNSALLALLAACGADERVILWPEAEPWAAASLVGVEADRVSEHTVLELADGRPASPIRLSSELEVLELVTVDRARVLAAQYRIDAERIGEAVIAAKTTEACGEAGEIREGRVRFPLDAPEVADAVSTYRESNARFVAQPPTPWVDQLVLEAPAPTELRCTSGGPFRLAPAFSSVYPVPTDALIEGQPRMDPGGEIRRLEILPDGRMLANSAEVLFLRRPDAPYVDDSKQVIRIFQDVPGRLNAERDDFILRPGPSAAEGEVLFTRQGLDGYTRLSSVRYDADGFAAPSVVTVLPSEARVRRLLEEESGLLIALMDNGTVLYTQDPTNTWGSLEVGLDGRMLAAIPGEAKQIVVTGASVISVIDFARETPSLTRIVDLPSSVLFTGDLSRNEAGEVTIAIAGRYGELFIQAGLKPGASWVPVPLSTVTSLDLRCLSAPDCGLRKIAVWLRAAFWVEHDAEPWVLIASEACRAPLVLRTQNGCLETSELTTSGISPVDLERLRGEEARGFQRQGDRTFSLGSAGSILEVLPP